MTNILKVLDLSTAHLSEEDSSLMNSGPLPVVMVGTYGFLVTTTEECETDLESLNDCIIYARSKGCSYILFDADADPVEDLPEYEW